MIRVVTVLGTRPDAIKLVPLIKAFERRPDRFASVVCATAQHRAMLDQVLDVFEVKPDYDLGIMRPSQSVSEVTQGVLARLDGVLAHERPDLVMVQGDTTTTFAAGLAAFYRRISIGHVEAGLRTGDKHQPFPEEVNRRLTATLADYHFAPTEGAKRNLLREGIDESCVMVTGNTGIDALWMVLARLNAQPLPVGRLAPLLARTARQRLVLVTAHRREHVGLGFEQICAALVDLVARHPDIVIVFPVHPNPNVKATVNRVLRGRERIELVEPLEYPEFVALLDRACLVLTDSGGIQEEAPSLGKPVLVLRRVTERLEGVEAGTAQLVGTSPRTIVTEATRLLTDPQAYERASRVSNPFGDGQASERIVAHLWDVFHDRCRARGPGHSRRACGTASMPGRVPGTAS